MIGPVSPDMFGARIQQAQSNQTTPFQQSSRVGKEPGGEFKEVLGKLINDVDQAQKQADLSLEQLAKGESTSIQDVVMKMEEADISFKLMKEVRNKLLDAYKEIMQMQA